MNKIRLALVGRPNVGKSALFNRICKKRKAIVHEEEGITRDRIYEDAELFGKAFEVIDTGGIRTSEGDDAFQDEITLQAQIAMEEADTIIMVVDCRVGVTNLDRYVASLLRKKGKKLCLAVNKVDDENFEDTVAEFYQLGIGDVFAISASHGHNIAELLECALEGVEPPEEENVEGLKIAFVGRPNVGKSTYVNALLDEKRCIVSPVAGTTRDAIDVAFSYNDIHYTLIDTAGIRKKKGESEVVDKFAAIRTERALSRADICIFMIDANEGLTAHDKRIATQIEEEGKGCILFVNKWDAIKGFQMEHCRQGILQEAPFLGHCPILFGSALTGRNTESIFEKIESVREAMHQRITTGRLNAFVADMMQRYHPPMVNGKRLRIYYLTQVSTNPPKFTFFINYKDLFVDSYKKYLINRFRETFGFEGIPLKFYTRAKKKQTKGQRLSQRKAPPSLESVLTVDELVFATPAEDIL